MVCYTSGPLRNSCADCSHLQLRPKGTPYGPISCRSRDHGKDPLTVGSEAWAGSNVRACLSEDVQYPAAIQGRTLRRLHGARPLSGESSQTVQSQIFFEFGNFNGH